MPELDKIWYVYNKTGFAYKVIDGRHMIGMDGNLDTIHDAIVEVKDHGVPGESVQLAEFIVHALNEKLKIHK